MNAKLVESIVQLIESLLPEERALLEEKLFIDLSEPTTNELTQLAARGGAFDFLYSEPDLYTLEDGEPVK
ncbi:MAG TPA: hypothetical protein V6D12_03490 [Candidatus Obscuribacterales bacterium]